MVVNGDYFYCVISDGAGSSEFAKEAAWCTVNTTADFCYSSGSEFFNDKREQIARNLIFDIQQALYGQAKKLNTDLSQMMCTLVLLCIDAKTMQYTTVHVGDGLIAKITDNKTEIISYPENGVTKQYTYMVNSEYILKHIRVTNGNCNGGDILLICSDGIYAEYSISIIAENYKEISHKEYTDDASCCIFKFSML